MTKQSLKKQTTKAMKEHVSLQVFEWKEAVYNSRLELAKTRYLKEQASYKRVVLPSFLAFKEVENQTKEGVFLSDHHKPLQLPNGHWVLYFKDSHFQEGLDALADTVKTAYQTELDQIKLDQQEILRKQILASFERDDEKEKQQIVEERESEAQKRVEEFFSDV